MFRALSGVVRRGCQTGRSQTPVNSNLVQHGGMLGFHAPEDLFAVGEDRFQVLDRQAGTEHDLTLVRDQGFDGWYVAGMQLGRNIECIRTDGDLGCTADCHCLTCLAL
jgi:hypothetical protein